jgi:hypothetical protein
MWWHTRKKSDFVFRRNGRVHLNRRGAPVQSITGRRAVHISLQGLYCSCRPVFCSHVTLSGYPLHSPVSPSLLFPCVAVCNHISNAVYLSVPCTVYINRLQRHSIQAVMVSTENPNFWHVYVFGPASFVCPWNLAYCTICDVTRSGVGKQWTVGAGCGG